MYERPPMTPFERQRMDELQARHDREPFPEGTVIDISKNWAFMVPRERPHSEDKPQRETQDEAS